MTKMFCDSCGTDLAGANPGHGVWEIGLKLNTFWRAEGHAVLLHLCGGCGYQAARLLGFCYDTGTILSIARKEMIDGVSVHGPNGGGLGDIAFNGIGGGHGIRWHGDEPNALLAGAMVRGKPWAKP